MKSCLQNFSLRYISDGYFYSHFTAFEVRAWMSNYFSLFYTETINFSCPYLDVGSLICISKNISVLHLLTELTLISLFWIWYRFVIHVCQTPFCVFVWLPIFISMKIDLSYSFRYLSATWLLFLDTSWPFSGYVDKIAFDQNSLQSLRFIYIYPYNKVHGASMGPTWVLSAPDGPHIGPMNLAIWIYTLPPSLASSG